MPNTMQWNHKSGTIENSSEMHPETFVLCARRKGAETRRVLPISIFASFALLHIQLTITEITGFPDSAYENDDSDLEMQPT